jgi:hypothetical protein
MRIEQLHLRRVASLLAFVSAAACNDEPTTPRDAELDRARQATLKYADLSQALADGYANINVVMPNMGHHYMKQVLVDERFEIESPEILVYASESGQMRLVAVEYAIPLDRSAEAPAGFTGSDDVWDRNTGFQLWLLHAWVHRDNPAGVFKSTNSNVP